MRLQLVTALYAVASLWGCAYPEPQDRCDGPCAVFAIDRPIAAPGNVITLEGNFDRDSVIYFPGSDEPRRLDSYGPHRVTATVPDNATAGDLYLLTNTNQTEPVPFRAVSFKPELTSFRSAYEQTTVGRFLGGSALFEHAYGTVVVAGPKIFILGGTTAADAPSAQVDSMLINADDTLADATSSVGKLATARFRHASVRIGPSVYAIGGATASGPSATVEGASLDVKYNLGAFGVLPDVVLTTPREGLAAAVIGNYVYAVGGKNETGDLATLERAPIYDNGLIGTFEAISGITLKTPRSGHTLAVVGNSLYVLGGTSAGTPVASVERLELFPDAYIGEPTVVGQLTAPRAYHSSVLVGDSLYVAGGMGESGPLVTVERLLLGDTLSASIASTLHTPRSGAMAVSAGNHVYLVGGVDDSGSQITTFERASIISGNTIPVSLDNFMALPSVHLTVPLSYPSAVVIGTTLYMIGGADGSGASIRVDKATIGPDGSIGEFSASGLLLKQKRMASALVVYNNDLYVLGGRTSIDFSTYTDKIERAHIDADGNLGPFETLGLTLDVPRGYSAAGVIGRNLMVFGGVTNGAPTYLDTVKTTPLDPGNGILAPFATQSTLPDPRAFHSLLVLPTAIGLYAGKVSDAAFLSGTIAAVATDGSIGSWMGTTQNPPAREGGVLVPIGDALFAIGGAGSGLFGTQSSKIGADDKLSPFVTSAMLARPRYGHAAVTIGNRVYVLGGNDSGGILDSIEAAIIR